jgi:Flp pilus assembly protein TadD
LNFFQPGGDFFSFVTRSVSTYPLSRRNELSGSSKQPFESRLEAKHMKTQWKSNRKRIFAGTLLVVIAGALAGTAGAESAGPGDYVDAIDKIKTSNRRSIHNYYAATNLCVAYIMTHDLEGAKNVCNSAVTEIETSLSRKFARNNSAKAKTYRKFLAIALSNRGVLHALAGDSELARGDFRDALELEARISAPEVNLARLAVS